MRILALIFLVALPVSWPAMTVAETVTPVRTIRAGETISHQDVVLSPQITNGAVSELSDVIGKEARIALYPQRPIFAQNLQEQAVVERNQRVQLIFVKNGLSIMTEGRALGRGATGEIVRAMNLSSKTIIFGKIAHDGALYVE